MHGVRPVPWGGLLVEGTGDSALISGPGPSLSEGQCCVQRCALGCLWACYGFGQPICSWAVLRCCFAAGFSTRRLAL